jgi:hypothetical protein
MSRTEVRRILGSKFREFKKTPASLNSTDDFIELAIHVFYEADNTCKGVEMFPPSNPLLGGEALLARSFRDVAALIQSLDDSVEMNSTGLLSRRLGLSLWAPNVETSVDDPVESVYAFRKGVFGT